MKRSASLSLNACLLALCLGGATAALASDSPARMEAGRWVGSNGMTLYSFDKDAAGSGKSVCNGPCAANWPPLLADDAAAAMGKWSLVTRDDGKRQWAYEGKPLYYWSKDQKPGDTTGDGFNNLWHVAK
jgi:predicted lipoprotein with Yx(FWY)xxD motif